MSTPHVDARPHLRRPRINPWLVVVVALAAALVALSAWVLLDRQTNAPEGLASPEVSAMLADRIVALNSGNAPAISSFYSQDAIVEERDIDPAFISRGRKDIGARLSGLPKLWKLMGIQASSESDVIQFGRYAAEAASIGKNWNGILVYKFDENGKIVHQWVIGP